MKQAVSSRYWLTFLVLLVLLLAACERPLQEPPDLQTVTPVTDPSPVPLTTPVTTPAGETQGESTGSGEQPATGATPVDGETPDTAGETPSSDTAVRTEEVIYRVVAGDTLGKIAERYGISVEALSAANGITDPNVLEVGQQLVVPVAGDVQETPPQDTADPGEGEEPRTQEEIYTVQAGDNLYRIGLRYGVDWEVLATYNNIQAPYWLEVGQPIRIPPEGYQPN